MCLAVFTEIHRHERERDTMLSVYGIMSKLQQSVHMLMLSVSLYSHTANQAIIQNNHITTLWGTIQLTIIRHARARLY